MSWLRIDLAAYQTMDLVNRIEAGPDSAEIKFRLLKLLVKTVPRPGKGHGRCEAVRWLTSGAADER